MWGAPGARGGRGSWCGREASVRSMARRSSSTGMSAVVRAMSMSLHCASAAPSAAQARAQESQALRGEA